MGPHTPHEKASWNLLMCSCDHSGDKVRIAGSERVIYCQDSQVAVQPFFSVTVAIGSWGCECMKKHLIAPINPGGIRCEPMGWPIEVSRKFLLFLGICIVLLFLANLAQSMAATRSKFDTTNKILFGDHSTKLISSKPIPHPAGSSARSQLLPAGQALPGSVELDVDHGHPDGHRLPAGPSDLSQGAAGVQRKKRRGKTETARRVETEAPFGRNAGSRGVALSGLDWFVWRGWVGHAVLESVSFQVG